MEEEQERSVIEGTPGGVDDIVDNLVVQAVQSTEESTTDSMKAKDMGAFSDSESDGGSSIDDDVAMKRNVFKFTARKSSRFLPSFHNHGAAELDEETLIKINEIIDQFPSVFTVHEEKSIEEDAGESTSLTDKGNSSIMSALNSGWNGFKDFWS